MGLRVLIGRKQAVVSTNDMSGDGVTALAERAVAMARVAPEDKYAGLADPALLAKNFPDLDLFDRELPDVSALEAMARRAEDAGRAVQGRQQVGRRLGLGRHRRHGAADQPRLLRRLSRLAPQHLDAGDRRRRHRDGDRLRLLLGAARRRSRCAGEDRAERRREGRGAAQPAQGFDPQGAGGVRFPRLRLDRRASGQRHQRRFDRAQDELPQGQAGRADFRAGASTSSTIRCAAAACARGRSTPRASPAGAWR